jgi:hypothetical protein
MSRRSRDAFLLLTLCSAGPARLAAQTGVTIYNDGRVMVRRTLPLAVGAGVSHHQLALGVLDPSSVFALDSGVTVLGGAYDAAVNEANTMRRAVGQSLRFVMGRTQTAADTITVTVLGVNPERFRLPSGQVVFQRPGLPLYPAEWVLTDPRLSLSVRTTVARPSLRLGYFTQGASWSADYSVVLGKGPARISGLASIASASLKVADGDVQLLAGSVGRGERSFDGLMAPQAKEMSSMRMADAAAQQQEIGEAHLYTIPGKVSLEPGVVTSVALFDPAFAPWERSFQLRGQIPWYGMLPQYGNEESPVPVEVFYTLKRMPKSPFGDLPIPGGTFRLYEPDDAGRLQLIGESAAGHTAAGQDLKLSAGSAFDLTAKRVQLTYSTRRDSVRTIATADYRVTITSAKDSAVTVEVLEERRGDWTVLSSSIPAEKVSSTRTRFRVRVPANGEASLTYRVRVIW